MDEKTLFSRHLEEVLANNDIQVKISNKEKLFEAYSKLQELKVHSYFELNEFDKFDEIDKEQKNIVTNYLNEGNITFITRNDEVLVTPSAKEPGSYQITYFDEKGAKSDSQQENLEDTVDYLFMNNILPINKNELEYLTQDGLRNMQQPSDAEHKRQFYMQQKTLER